MYLSSNPDGTTSFDILELFIVHMNPSRSFISNLRKRVIRARTSISLFSMLDASSPIVTTPSPCGRFHLYGHPSAVESALSETSSSNLIRLAREQIEDFDTIKKEELENSMVSALLPIAGPGSGWPRVPGWIAFLRPLSGRVGPEAEPLADAFEAWLNKSEGWLEGRPVEAVDIATRLGYNDVVEMLTHR